MNVMYADINELLAELENERSEFYPDVTRAKIIRLSDFVERHPTMKMLALSFLILIGVMLFSEGLHFHIPKGYVYFAMAFSIIVEFLNLRLRSASKPVKLQQSYVEE